MNDLPFFEPDSVVSCKQATSDIELEPFLATLPPLPKLLPPPVTAPIAPLAKSLQPQPVKGPFKAFPARKSQKMRSQALAHAERTGPLFWTTTLICSSLALTVLTWGLARFSAEPEKDLRRVVVSPKFKATDPRPAPAKQSTKIVALLGPQEPTPPVVPPPFIAPPAVLPSAPSLAPMSEPNRLELPLALPPLPEPPAPAAPLEILPNIRVQEPVVPPVEMPTTPLIFVSDSQPGESPMIRNWKTLALYSLFAGSLTQPTVVLAQGEVKENKDSALTKRFDDMEDRLKNSFEDVRKEIDKLVQATKDTRKDLKDIGGSVSKLETDLLQYKVEMDKASFKIGTLEDQVNKLTKDVADLRLNGAKVQQSGAADKDTLDYLKTALGKIEEAILKLQPNTSRVALSPPTPPPPASAEGRVILINEYPEQLLFIVNKKSYRVAPHSQMPLEHLTSGALSYEVISPTWGLRGQSDTTLAAGETFTLMAR